MITKAEVRAVVLSKLSLQSDHIFWDLGAGSGAVSIEASLFVKTGKIFAFEKNPQRIEHIRINRERFNVKNMEIVCETLPQGLSTYPQPDRIFIGGGGKMLCDILLASSALLKAGGVVVVNTVLFETVEGVRKTLKQLNHDWEIVQVQVNRGREMPWGERLEAQNPVWIIAGTKGSS